GLVKSLREARGLTGAQILKLSAEELEELLEELESPEDPGERTRFRLRVQEGVKGDWDLSRAKSRAYRDQQLLRGRKKEGDRVGGMPVGPGAGAGLLTAPLLGD